MAPSPRWADGPGDLKGPHQDSAQSDIGLRRPLRRALPVRDHGPSTVRTTLSGCRSRCRSRVPGPDRASAIPGPPRRGLTPQSARDQGEREYKPACTQGDQCRHIRCAETHRISLLPLPGPPRDSAAAAGPLLVCPVLRARARFRGRLRGRRGRDGEEEHADGSPANGDARTIQCIRATMSKPSESGMRPHQLAVPRSAALCALGKAARTSALLHCLRSSGVAVAGWPD